MADDINERCFERLGNNIWEYEAVTVLGPNPGNVESRFKARALLKLCVGARVQILDNVEGCSTGQCGVVLHLNENSVTVQLDDHFGVRTFHPHTFKLGRHEQHRRTQIPLIPDFARYVKWLNTWRLSCLLVQYTRVLVGDSTGYWYTWPKRSSLGWARLHSRVEVFIRFFKLASCTRRYLHWLLADSFKSTGWTLLPRIDIW